MSIVAIRIRVLVAALTCGAVSCTKAEKHVDLPEPIPIAQWAESVDTLPGTYTYPSPPAQFWDSVIVIVDAQDRVAWRTDLYNKTRVQLGSRGNGPGEYQSPGSPLKVQADSVALVIGTAYNAFPIISVKTGRGRTYKVPTAKVGQASEALLSSMSWPFLYYADTLGYMYGAPEIAPPVLGNKDGHRVPFVVKSLDTVPIVRISIATGKADTLMQLPRGELQGEVKRDANGRAIRSIMALGPYGAYNAWTATADGRVLVATASNYELNILNGSGVFTAKWKLASIAPAVSENGWKAYVEKTKTGLPIALQKLQNETFAKMGVAAPKQPTNQYVTPKMPAVLPPLQFGRGWKGIPVVGNVAWVPVNRVDPPTNSHWDLVDITTGKRIETVVLPDRQAVRGVTNLGVYVYAIDDDDLYRILLYRQRTPIDSKTTPKTHQ